jgi:iron complex outermembrane receptor protein
MRFTSICFTLMALIVMAVPANAQDETIIVTATKRDGVRAEDVAGALNVFDANQLAARNVTALTGLSYAMPNVQLEDIGTGRGVANLSIRGVGINSSIASVDPAVGLFVDGMYVAMNAGALSALYDLDAVEVLRGPQGTLYGRNVTGGAVLVRTRAPTDYFEARGRVAVETGPETIADFSISGPLAPGLIDGRIAVLHDADDGWFSNRFDGASFGRNVTDIYRGALRFTPNAGVDVTLRAEQGNENGDGPTAQNHALFRRGSFDFSINNPGYTRTDWEQAILEANWRLGPGHITSISGWRDTSMGWAADIDSTPTFVFHTRILNIAEQTSEELRYAGAFGAIDNVTGLYWLDERLKYFDERNFPTAPRRTGGGVGDFSTWALYSNNDWHLTNTLTVSGGLRYTHEQKRSHIARIRPDNSGLAGALGQIGGDLDAQTLNFVDAPIDQSWNDLSPRVGVQWRPNEVTNIYATWSEGFRSGGVNFRTTTVALAPLPYNAERTSAYEIGFKRRLQDGRGYFNLAIFHNRIEDMQRETNIADPIVGVQQLVVNAGDATLYGGELEAAFALGDALTIEAHAGYTHGAYDRVTQDLNGDLVVTAADQRLHIPRLAPWSYGLSLDYQRGLMGGEVNARISLDHRDASFYNDTNLGRLAAADIVDANVSFSPAHARWAVSVYGRNLTNEATWGGDTTLPSIAAFGYAGGERPTFSPLNEGRVLGVELRLSN